VQVYALEAEKIFLHASRLCGTLVIKVILCGQGSKSKVNGQASNVSHCTCIEELETMGLIINLARPRVAGSRKCHVRDSHLKAGVAHAAMLHGKLHNHAWHHAKKCHAL